MRQVEAQNKDTAVRKPFDLDALNKEAGPDGLVTIVPKPKPELRDFALKTSASLQGNALNVLSPANATTRNQTNFGSQAAWNNKDKNTEHLKIEDMENDVFNITGQPR